jgi:hypothetical protein
MNARYIQKLGDGLCASTLDAPPPSAPSKPTSRCEEQLAAYRQDGNRALIDALDAWLTARARVGSLARSLGLRAGERRGTRWAPAMSARFCVRRERRSVAR